MTLTERAELEAMLLNGGMEANSAASRPDELPLTPGQASLWFLEKLRPNLPTYNVPQAFRLRGGLNEGALRQAIQMVVDRHDALRAQFREENESLTWTVRDWPGEFEWTVRETEPEKVEGELQYFITRKFNLALEPMLRVGVWKVKPGEQVVCFVWPHIICDMMSLQLFYREIQEAYTALVSGQPVHFKSASLQFTDFAQEQGRVSLSEEDADFWKKYLQGATPGNPLPNDAGRSTRGDGKGELYFFHLGPDITARVQSFCKQSGSSPYMVYLAAWQLLIARYSGSSDFLLGVPFSQRDFPEADTVFGYLINLLVYRATPSKELTFRELSGQVRDAALELYDHPRVPFSEIVKELKLPREGGNSLCPVVFQYLPDGFAELRLPGLATEVIWLDTKTAKFDLTLTLAAEKEGTIGEIEYRTDLYHPETIARLAKHFAQLLRALLDSPDQPVGRIDFLNDHERGQLLGEWSSAKSDYPRESNVPRLFEAQVAAEPGRKAVTFGENTLTYAQLNALANQLAHYLRGRGVQAGEYIGLTQERSEFLVPAILAILKVGGVYVPLDTKYPVDRLESMLSDAKVVRVLTTRNDFELAGREIIRLRQITRDLAKQPEANLELAIKPLDPCYVMYTSGSTGKPKGVIVPHRAVVRLVKNTNFASFGKEEVFLQFAPLAFDASTLEIWGGLLNGGQVIVYPEVFESLEQFEQVLLTHRVTTLWLTAGLFNSMIDQRPLALGGVKQLLVGGDVLSVPHIRKAQAALPKTALINGYGPTENTTFSCCYRIPAEWPAERSIPVGKPISNSTVFILDDSMQPVPQGVFGEILAGGDGLALGYLADEKLTRDRFVPHPFVEGERLYRTGDHGRFLANGVIEFLGRLDNQVKIRGFRIELGEIELALKRIKGVRDAAVVALPEPSGTRVIVAYVVAAKGARLRAADLREEAGRGLPDYMVPSHVVFMDELPLNANGKVQRSSLPAPDLSPASGQLVLPSTDAEHRLAAIWKEVLNRPEVGVTENFFDLGGHSLLATRIISRANQAFQVRLSLATLFESPTISSMARRVEELSRKPSKPAEPKAIVPEAASVTSRVDQMDDAEVDALLNQLLPKA